MDGISFLVLYILINLFKLKWNVIYCVCISDCWLGGIFCKAISGWLNICLHFWHSCFVVGVCVLIVLPGNLQPILAGLRMFVAHDEGDE